ncbi:MAG: hypothetical protein ACLFPI_07800 [Desulfobacterales bacterium]
MYELITTTNGSVLSREPFESILDAEKAMDRAVKENKWPNQKPAVIKIEALADVRIMTRMHLIE